MIRINLLKPRGTAGPLAAISSEQGSVKASILSRREAVIGMVFVTMGSGALFYLASRPSPVKQPASPAQSARVEPPPSPVVKTEPPRPAPSAETAEGCRLTEFSVARELDAVTVTIRTGAEAKYRAFELSKPERIVVDLPDCRLALTSGNQTRQVEHPVLQAVRVSQFRMEPVVARVVLDLKSMPRYQIRSVPAGVEIRVVGGQP